MNLHPVPPLNHQGALWRSAPKYCKQENECKQVKSAFIMKEGL